MQQAASRPDVARGPALAPSKVVRIAATHRPLVGGMYDPCRVTLETYDGEVVMAGHMTGGPKVGLGTR